MKHFNQNIKEPLLKPFKVPKGFVLCLDTREQLPLFTDPIPGLTIQRKTLHFGDYSIKGFEDRIGFERKQMSDLYSYVGKERKRTVRKLEQLRELDFAALIVEASFEDLKIPYSYSSRITPEMIRQFMVSVNVRYGIHVFCDRDRMALEVWLLDRAIKYYKIQREI